MDPCQFVRIHIENLSLKLPQPTNSSLTHPTTTPYFGKIHLKYFPSQTVPIPLCPSPSSSSSSTTTSQADSGTSAAGYHLDPSSFRRLSDKKAPVSLHLSVYAGQMRRTCGVTVDHGKRLGRVRVRVHLDEAQTRPALYQNGWVKIGPKTNEETSCTKLHLVVRSEPDPRFVLQFDGELKCSPVVFQIQNIRQPVFSCRFSSARIRSQQSNSADNRRLTTLCRDKARHLRERKGWMIMIHDLSGSAVAAASMITPFVPSPGTNCVSRSNPGAWLILQTRGHHVSNWKPWGRVEAWRERGHTDELGYKFELAPQNGQSTGILVAEGTMSTQKGGHFCIDNNVLRHYVPGSVPPFRGFVMASTVGGEGKVSKPVVQIGAVHVTCMADAALFIALAAAIDLSMDACRLFSTGHIKQVCHDEEDCFC